VTPQADGLLLIDKPSGPTSHDVVARVRAATGIRRVGHTGTLDPPATGLLAIVLGRATRLARFLPAEPKHYAGEVELGVTTSTDDLQGEVLARHAGPPPDSDDVLRAAGSLTGDRLQVPPAVSARQVAGQRLYRLARRGTPIEAPASRVHVERFELEPTPSPLRWRFVAVVSSGTYVRALVRDLGRSLGGGAAVAALRRTAIGPLRVEDAIVLPARSEEIRDLAASHVVPLREIPLAVPSVRLADVEALCRFASGRAVSWPDGGGEEGLVAVFDATGELAGIGETLGSVLHPRVVLAER